MKVAPARERGLKYPMWTYIGYKLKSRSRKGAWIEMMFRTGTYDKSGVAPARERGLKSGVPNIGIGRIQSLPQGSVD